MSELILIIILSLKIQNKKHAKLQNFVQVASKILSLHALNFTKRIENLS